MQNVAWFSSFSINGQQAIESRILYNISTSTNNKSCSMTRGVHMSDLIHDAMLEIGLPALSKRVKLRGSR